MRSLAFVERGLMEQTNGVGWLMGGVQARQLEGNSSPLNKGRIPDETRYIVRRRSDLLAPLVPGLRDVEQGDDTSGSEPDTCFRKVAPRAKPTPEAKYNLARVGELGGLPVHLEPSVRAERLGLWIVGRVLGHFPAAVMR